MIKSTREKNVPKGREQTNPSSTSGEDLSLRPWETEGQRRGPEGPGIVGSSSKALELRWWKADSFTRCLMYSFIHLMINNGRYWYVDNRISRFFGGRGDIPTCSKMLRDRVSWPRLFLQGGGKEPLARSQNWSHLFFSEIGQPGWDHLAMTKQKLLLNGTFSLILIVACEAQQLPRSHAASSSGPLCEKEAESWGNLLSSERLDAWICSLIGSFMVGLSGIFPLLVIPFETGAALRSEGQPVTCISLPEAIGPGLWLWQTGLWIMPVLQKYSPPVQALHFQLLQAIAFDLVVSPLTNASPGRRLYKEYHLYTLGSCRDQNLPTHSCSSQVVQGLLLALQLFLSCSLFWKLGLPMLLIEVFLCKSSAGNILTSSWVLIGFCLFF